MSLSSAIAGAGGGPPRPVDGGVALPTPTECSIASNFRSDIVYSLRNFNVDTILVVNGSGENRSKIVEILTPIGIKIGKSNGENTQILIRSSVPKDEGKRDRDSRLASEERVKNTNFGVVVPPEHSLAYAKKLFERYQIMLEKGEWKNESLATGQRKSITKAGEKRHAAYKAGAGKGTNNSEYKKEKSAEQNAKRAREEDE